MKPIQEKMIRRKIAISRAPIRSWMKRPKGSMAYPPRLFAFA